MKERAEIPFTLTELRELKRSRVHAAFVQALEERVEKLQFDLGLPSQTKTLDVVRAMQGAISENRAWLAWFDAAENSLKHEENENA